MQPKQNWLFKMLYILGLFILVIPEWSCRKIDVPKEKTLRGNLTDRFFNAHKSENSHIKQLSDYLLRLTGKTDLVEKIATEYGIPYWDKALLYNNGNTGAISRVMTKNEAFTLVAHIPLLNDNDTTVRAQLTIWATSTDTTF